MTRTKTSRDERPHERLRPPGKREWRRLVVASVILITWIIGLVLMASLT